MDKVNLAEKFSRFSDQWSPKIVGEVNDAQVKLARISGEFVWHSHEKEDELFFVVKGRMTIKFRDRDIEVGEGEFIVVPCGVEHCPVAEEECQIMLLEPKTVINTGDAETSDRTVEAPEWI
ncbi:MAG: cupin domain-containing protein [Rhodospirillales bacterium]|nr:cupin domain-containing protein [Rhodospirillales bacterium]